MSFNNAENRDHATLNQIGKAPATPGTMMCSGCWRRLPREAFPSSTLRISTRCTPCQPKNRIK